jgi:hypothetical protein
MVKAISRDPTANTNRIPIGFWAVEKHADEPYLEGVSWTYFLKAISWGRKYGIRILLDFHALPGESRLFHTHRLLLVPTLIPICALGWTTCECPRARPVDKD